MYPGLRFKFGSLCLTAPCFRKTSEYLEGPTRPLDLDAQWKGRKILGVGKRPEWTSSVALDPSRMKFTRTKSNSELDPGKPYQYNYRAEALPPKSPDPLPRQNMVSLSNDALVPRCSRILKPGIGYIPWVPSPPQRPFFTPLPRRSRSFVERLRARWKQWVNGYYYLPTLLQARVGKTP